MRCSRPASASFVPIVLALLLAASPAAAAAPLAGRVALADGTPAAGWTVSVVGQPGSVRCDAEGRFVLAAAPRPPFTLIATGPDGAISSPVEVAALPEGGELAVTLPPVARDSVTVVSGVAPSLDTLPASAATVVAQEELEQRTPQRLYQVLESVAGASKLGDGADSVPALRGLARGRTLILLDGARVTAERRAGPSATFVEPDSLASIEVLRGPGSVVYGSDAFGGVINAITRDPVSDGRALSYGLELGTDAIDQQSAFVSGSTPLGEHAALLLEGHWRSADDAEAGGGTEIYNSSFDGMGGAARYLQELGSGQLRLGLSIDRMEDLGKAAVDSRQITAVYPLEDSDRLVGSWIGTPGGGWESLEASGFYGRYQIILDRDRAATSSSNRRVDTADTDAKDASARVVGARPLAGGRLQIGLDAYSRFDLHALTTRTNYAADATTVSSRTTQVSIDEAEQLATGAFATWNRGLGSHLQLGVGVRGDFIKAENHGGFFGDRSSDDSALSGNLSLTVGPFAGWTTTAQLARGFRTPTLSDRYFRGPSGRGFVTGNPDLQPETSTQLDLATRWGRGRTAVGVYAYHYEIDDLIERYGSGDDFLFRNRGKATIQGLEVEVQTAFGDHWSGELGAAWADGETDGGAEIDDIAAPNAFATLRFTAGRFYALGRVTSYLEHDEPGPTELARPGYTVLDAGGGWHWTEWLELRLLVRNLSDHRYYAAADNAADRAIGRSITFGVGGRVP